MGVGGVGGGVGEGVGVGVGGGGVGGIDGGGGVGAAVRFTNCEGCPPGCGTITQGLGVGAHEGASVGAVVGNGVGTGVGKMHVTCSGTTCRRPSFASYSVQGVTTCVGDHALVVALTIRRFGPMPPPPFPSSCASHEAVVYPRWSPDHTVSCHCPAAAL